MPATDTIEKVLHYSYLRSCWCVRPTLHTNYLDVVDWCFAQWGNFAIKDEVDGTWSYCDGTYYGLAYRHLKHSFPDHRLYFSFKNQDDAVLFMLRWS